MPIAAPLIIGGASLASGIIGANAASNAADKQAEAAANALALQKQMFDQTQANFSPYLNIGKGATTSLGALYGIDANGNQSNANVDYSQFYNSPDYGFAQQQGNLALDRANNAKGLSLSGGALKDAMQFNQGLATQQFGNYFNRLLSLSQLGGNAASAAAGSAQNFSNQMSNSVQGQGQAQASGIIGGANALTGGINSGVTNSLLYNAINRSSYAAPMAGSPSMFGGITAPGGWW
jgi:hypothetical protein